MKWFTLILIGSTFYAQAAIAKCTVTPHGAISPEIKELSSQWRVEKNTTCVSLGATNTGMKIVKQAQHGVAGTDSSLIGRHWAYRPNPDYVGSDSFSVLVQANIAGYNYPITVNVTVDVVPAL
jgi:hypothetical protein